MLKLYNYNHFALRIIQIQNYLNISHLFQLFQLFISDLNQINDYTSILILQFDFQIKTLALIQKLSNFRISMKRILGFRVLFNNPSFDSLLKKKQEILKLVDMHGCICLQNIDFTPKQMQEFTKGVWSEIIQLPEYLAFNNQDPSLKTVVRIGNVQNDGTLKDSSKQAIYWHQDGDFMGKGKNHIYNCLHSKQVPKRGGDTQILDLVGGAKFIKTKYPQIFKRLNELIGQLNMDDIEDFKLQQAKKQFAFQKITNHSLVNKFGRYGYEESLFLSVFKFLDRNNLKQVDDLKVSEIIDLIQNEMGIYSHKWRKGDMLIWDNFQVMHRSAGGFEGRRLLYRTQGRFLNQLQ